MNRNEPLPAITTRQSDFGIRWTLRPRLNLLAGLFDVRKPYFNLDATGRFALLGDVRHRGLELSLTGELSPRLRVLAGAVLLEPRVTGVGVSLGRVGRIPLNQPERIFRANLDWQPSFAERASFDAGIAHASRRAATSDNAVFLPARTTVDVGARYRFDLGGNDALLRASISNLIDERGFDLRGSGAYVLSPSRVASLNLSVDF